MWTDTHVLSHTCFSTFIGIAYQHYLDEVTRNILTDLSETKNLFMFLLPFKQITA